MPRHPAMLLLLLGLFAAAPAAQEPAKAERLQELLRELRGTDAATWAERLAALEAQAKAQEAEADALRAKAKDLEQRAAAATAKASALRAEQGRLRELQQLLTTLPATDSAPPPAVAAAPPATPATMPDRPEPAAAMAGAKDLPAAAAEMVTWTQVSTLFADSCTGCHDPEDQKGGLDLSTFRAARNGGGSGQSIVAGEPEQSRLYRMITQQERPFMPREGDALTREQQALLRTWIEQGAAEDADGARTFLAEKANHQKAAAAAAEAMAGADQGAAPMPESLPQVAVRTADRPGPVASLVRSPRAPLLALAGVQQVLLYGSDLQPLAVLPCDLPHLGPLAFAEDGSALLAAGGEPGRRGAAVLFDVRSGAVLATCGAERDVPLAAAVHRGAGLVALGGSSKLARVLRLADSVEVLAGKHDDFVLSLCFAPDGRWLAAGDRAGVVQVWETPGGRLFQSLRGHQGAVNAVAFDRSGKSLLSAGADGTLRLWDVAEAKERWRQNAHPNQQALAVAFGPGGAVASCGSDGVIQVYTQAGRAVGKSPATGEWLYSVAFGADDDTVFAGDWQGRVHRFAVKSRQLTASVPLAATQ